MTSDIEHRKRAHIDTVLSEDVGAKGITTGFEHVYFEHVALPEIDLDAVNMQSFVFGKTLAAPLLISSMTGGTDIAQNINRHLAEAAQEMEIAMGVGSQRAAIVDPMFADTFRVRSVAPDILLFANLGAIQFNYGFTPDDARKAVDMIGADALFLHLNPLQEAVQAEGDRSWAGVLEKIGELAGASGCACDRERGRQRHLWCAGAAASGYRRRRDRRCGGWRYQLERGRGASPA